MDPSIMLPPDLAVSERSRKFYDGTYKWDSEGFTDDNGVYRQFNADDPTARAPTPLPPFLGHPEREDKEGSGTEEQPLSPADVSQATNSNALRADEGAAPEASQSAKSKAQHSNLSPEIFKFSSPDAVITMRRDELFRGRGDREQLLTKLRDIQLDSQYTKIELTLEECYRLCGIPDVATTAEMSSKGEAVQTGSSKNGTDTEREGNQVKPGQTSISTQNDGADVNGSDSDLSDCRSDISDGGLRKTVKDGKRAQKMAAGVDSHKEDDHDASQPKQKVTRGKAMIRGVAQKVRKGTARKVTKGTRAGKSAMAAPALLSLQTNSSVDVSPGGEDSLGRRRSTRLARRGGK